MQITAPSKSDYPEFYGTYVRKVAPLDLIPGMEDDLSQLKQLVASLSPEQIEHRYAPDKWNMKQLLGHIIDAERVFAYRTLWFARNMKEPVDGMDQEHFCQFDNSDNRSIADLLEEFEHVRLSTIALFKSFTEDHLSMTGTASGGHFTVRAKGFIILGHSTHHRMVYEERYLNT
ncbi:MAG: DinB family protein [Cyclobacteriaceae bacterium]